ncbi:replication protein [Bacillus thuringiensis]|uniref:replication protein n=1 Tax=Bacillus cereus group TaxID=86661 RepID=UPI003F227735
MSETQLVGQTPTFITQGHVPKEELRLPNQHFITAMDWIDKLGESAYCDYLKMYTMADRRDKDREYDRVPRALSSLWEALDRKEKYFRQKILIPLWEYGLVDLVEYQGEHARAGHKPMNIVIYRYPCNDITLLTKPLEKVRDWKKDYKSSGKFYAIKGGRPKNEVKDSPQNPLVKDSPQKPLKDSPQNPINNTKELNNLLNYFNKYVSIDLSPIDFFKFAIVSSPSKYVEIELNNLTTTYGKDIVNEAIKRISDMKTDKYIATIKGIIKKWVSQGMNSFSDIENVEKAYLEERKQLQKPKSQQKPNSLKPSYGKKDIVPEWLKEQKLKDEEVQTNKELHQNGESIQVTTETIKEKIRFYEKKLNKYITEDITEDNWKVAKIYLDAKWNWTEIGILFKEIDEMKNAIQ